MKATLVFSLPDESEEHKYALNGWKYKYVIDQVYNFIRKKEKYGEDVTPQELEAYNNIRNLLTEELGDL